MKFLLDSVILVDHFNGIKPATEFLRATGAEACLSVITRAEVLAGFDESRWTAALELIDLLPTLPLTVRTADIAARLRRSQALRLPDALQGALAAEHRLVLATRDARDFGRREGFEVLLPYRLP